MSSVTPKAPSFALFVVPNGIDTQSLAAASSILATVLILISPLVVAVVLTAGGATALAQDEPVKVETVEQEVQVPPRYGNTELMAKAAAILGITPQELVAVFEQAQKELEDEVFIKYVKQAAEKGIITPDEAEEIIKWWQARPEAVDKLLPWNQLPTVTQNRRMETNRIRIQEKTATGKTQIQMRNRLKIADPSKLEAGSVKPVPVKQQVTTSNKWQQQQPKASVK